MAQVLGFNTPVKLNDGSSNTFVAFVNPTEASLPFGTVELEKFQTLTQSTNQWQYIVSGYDGGKFKFVMQYNSADEARLVLVRGLNFITGTTRVQFQVVTNDATPVTYTIPVIVETVDTPVTAANKITMTTVTAQIVAPITVA